MDDKRVDWVTVILFLGVMMTLAALFVAEKLFPTDGQMFQVVAGLVTAFSGALFTRIKPLLNQGSGTTSTPPGITPPTPPPVP